MPTTAFLFPGQGGYRPGAIGDEANDEVVAMFDSIDRVASQSGRAPVSHLLKTTEAPPATELRDSDPFSLQLAVYAVGVAGYLLAKPHYKPDVLVGNSMGEFAALACAGVFTFEEAARLVALRSIALEERASTNPGSMIAVGLNERRSHHLVGLIDHPQLAVAVTNAPTQTVLSGPTSEIEKAHRLVNELGSVSTLIAAPYGFHSRLLAAAAERFEEAIVDIPQGRSHHRVYSPLKGCYLHDRFDAKQLLVEQLTNPVDFLTAIRTLHADGVHTFVECGRSGLASVINKSIPDVEVVSPSSTTVPSGNNGHVVDGPAFSPRSTGSNGVVGQLNKTTPEAESSTAQAALSDKDVKPVVEPQIVDDVDVLAELIELYATTLGYPQEAITADADLEADLGVDSLKRAEMLGKVRSRFGIQDTAKDGLFLAQGTLGDLAQVVQRS